MSLRRGLNIRDVACQISVVNGKWYSASFSYENAPSEFTEDQRNDFKGAAMIEIQLIGSTKAVFGDLEYNHPRKDPVGPLIRKMIDVGLCSPDDMVIVRRGDTVCFNPAPARVWSEHTIMCQDKGGITKSKYTPFHFVPS